jgi:hypothetical protein
VELMFLRGMPSPTSLRRGHRPAWWSGSAVARPASGCPALLEVVVVFVMLDAHSGAFSSAPLPLTSFESGLLLNGAISKGLGLQAVVGDACAAFDRPSEGALLDPRFGAGHGRKLAL